MFESYQYGSDLLDVSFDPSAADEFASFAFDDEGSLAHKHYLIRDGILQRGLGGLTSQQRSGLKGVPNSRACSWNRAPIDRMTNINLEPGTRPFEDRFSTLETCTYMQSNSSWSIDDSRNKFQFGCEHAQLIRGGELTQVVKKPNYRAISATFWRQLSGVGKADTGAILGTPYCGKGEPNQCVHVGHVSPACRFDAVAVFGGD